MKKTEDISPPVPYEIIRSGRGTVGIVVREDGSVIVRAPMRMPEAAIEEIMKKKETWIRRKQKEIKEERKRRTIRRFRPGELFLYRGSEYVLSIKERLSIKKAEVTLQEGRIEVILPCFEEEAAKKALEDWYRRMALRVITERVEYFRKQIGEPVNRIRVKDQRTRWGSCSSKGNLNFNWKLIMAPAGVLDYVVVHELCHLKQMNHSRAFWKLVKEILPDYEQSELWLKKNGKAILY